MKRFFLFLLCIFFLFSCGLKGKDGSDGTNGTNGSDGVNGEDGADGIDGTDGIDGPQGEPGTIDDGDTIGANTVSNPSGKIETAFCKKGTVIWATSVDATWTQTGALSGEVKTNDGSYVVRGDFSGPFISFLVPSGTCYNEAHNTYANNVILRGMEHTSATEHNKNYATSLEYYIAEDHFFDPTSAGYDSIPESFPLAKSEILDYFNFPQMTKDFNELSVVGDTTADAYLLAFETYITDAGGGPEQYDRLVEIGIAIMDADLSYRSTVRNFVENIKVKEVTDNIKNERVSLGFSDDVAPLWNLPFYPDYYEDLLTRSPTILEWINQNATSTTAFDTTGYNSFAYPTVFNSIESAVYFASELTGSLSIWSVGTCNHGTDYPCPLAELVTIEELNEVLLEPVMNHNGFLDEHGLTNGTQYFIVQEFGDYTHQPSHAADGDMLPFGRNLAAIDNNWGAAIGWNNTTTWFRRSPKSFITD